MSVITTDCKISSVHWGCSFPTIIQGTPKWGYNYSHLPPTDADIQWSTSAHTFSMIIFLTREFPPRSYMWTEGKMIWGRHVGQGYLGSCSVSLVFLHTGWSDDRLVGPPYYSFGCLPFYLGEDPFPWSGVSDKFPEGLLFLMFNITHIISISYKKPGYLVLCITPPVAPEAKPLTSHAQTLWDRKQPAVTFGKVCWKEPSFSSKRKAMAVIPLASHQIFHRVPIWARDLEHSWNLTAIRNS